MKGDTEKLQILSEVSIIVRRVSEYLGPTYVRLPTSEREVQELVSQFHVYHGFP